MILRNILYLNGFLGFLGLFFCVVKLFFYPEYSSHFIDLVMAATIGNIILLRINPFGKRKSTQLMFFLMAILMLLALFITFIALVFKIEEAVLFSRVLLITGIFVYCLIPENEGLLWKFGINQTSKPSILQSKKEHHQMDHANIDDLDSTQAYLIGVIKWFDMGKKFGFIHTEAGDDIFVHISAIKRYNKRKKIQLGQQVKFKVKTGEKGIYASEVYL